MANLEKEEDETKFCDGFKFKLVRKKVQIKNLMMPKVLIDAEKTLASVKVGNRIYIYLKFVAEPIYQRNREEMIQTFCVSSIEEILFIDDDFQIFE